MHPLTQLKSGSLLIGTATQSKSRHRARTRKVLLPCTFMAFFSSTTNTPAGPAQKDVEVADPPTDSISTLAFSGQADFLAVGSWDNSVRSL
jgi:hypothetical protein